MSIDHGVYIDALAYTDKGYDDDGVKEAALSLVEEEVRRYRPTKNYLEYLSLPPLPAESEIMKTELERISNRIPMERLSTRRYEIPIPPATKTTDLKAWQLSLDNCHAQISSSVLRIQNLNEIKMYEGDIWKKHLEDLERMRDVAATRRTKRREDIQEVNWMRKKEQTAVGEKLRGLEESWVGLVGKNYEIEQANLELEAEIAALMASEPHDSAEGGQAVEPTCES